LVNHKADEDRPCSFPRRLQHGSSGFGIETPRPTLSGWQVKAVDEGQEPEASSDEPGDGAG